MTSVIQYLWKAEPKDGNQSRFKTDNCNFQRRGRCSINKKGYPRYFMLFEFLEQFETGSASWKKERDREKSQEGERKATQEINSGYRTLSELAEKKFYIVISKWTLCPDLTKSSDIIKFGIWARVLRIIKK